MQGRVSDRGRGRASSVENRGRGRKSAIGTRQKSSPRASSWSIRDSLLATPLRSVILLCASKISSLSPLLGCHPSSSAASRSSHCDSHKARRKLPALHRLYRYEVEANITRRRSLGHKGRQGTSDIFTSGWTLTGFPRQTAQCGSLVLFAPTWTTSGLLAGSLGRSGPARGKTQSLKHGKEKTLPSAWHKALHRVRNENLVGKTLWARKVAWKAEGVISPLETCAGLVY